MLRGTPVGAARPRREEYQLARMIMVYEYFRVALEAAPEYRRKPRHVASLRCTFRTVSERFIRDAFETVQAKEIPFREPS